MEYIVGIFKFYLSKILLKIKMILREKKNNNNNCLIYKVVYKFFVNKNNKGVKLFFGIIFFIFIIKV